ncbi:MAG: hypothetical protein WCP45_17725 [Verrucomicrobiota bacterium]
MSHIATPAYFYRNPKAGNHGFRRVMQCLKLTFFCGPKVLFTSQISLKCAAAMITMCAPALFFCAILTLPALVFQSPQQNAYFYFARILNEDPTRWAVLILAGLCVVLSLSLPATMAAPRTVR